MTGFAAIGKSLVNVRNKGTQQATVETAITNTTEIGENEHALYRKVTQSVYDDQSLTEAVRYERTHRQREATIAELTKTK